MDGRHQCVGVRNTAPHRSAVQHISWAAGLVGIPSIHSQAVSQSLHPVVVAALHLLFVVRAARQDITAADLTARVTHWQSAHVTNRERQGAALRPSTWWAAYWLVCCCVHAARSVFLDVCGPLNALTAELSSEAGHTADHTRTHTTHTQRESERWVNEVPSVHTRVHPVCACLTGVCVSTLFSRSHCHVSCPSAAAHSVCGLQFLSPPACST